MAVFVVVIFAPTSTQSSKSFFKEFTNQDGVVIKDGSKVRITALTIWLSSNKIVVVLDYSAMMSLIQP